MRHHGSVHCRASNKLTIKYSRHRDTPSLEPKNTTNAAATSPEHLTDTIIWLFLDDNPIYGVDSSQAVHYGDVMADEPKRETQRERALIDPVLKFLFDKDREEIVRFARWFSI